jgi:catechol 2,3-dioxygenase-like lactoylglutathione lyase family enzyme
MELSVRYIVDDTSTAITFYELLGFETVMHPAPGFAMLRRGELRLLLNTPGGGGGAGQSGADGTPPAPGGWNRFQLGVDDIEAEVARLGDAGATFRSPVIDGNGGRQVLVDDPSGNPVELFQAWPEGQGADPRSTR